MSDTPQYESAIATPDDIVSFESFGYAHSFDANRNMQMGIRNNEDDGLVYFNFHNKLNKEQPTQYLTLSREAAEYIAKHLPVLLAIKRDADGVVIPRNMVSINFYKTTSPNVDAENSSADLSGREQEL